jgi:polar amino acid transport system ATP-binding protein
MVSAATTAASGGPLVRVGGLHKSFGDKVVLQDVSLEVAEGETVVIIGASGSGKTTLLRCINYLERPNAGTIEVSGEAIGGRFDEGGRWIAASERTLARQRQRIGFVFQRFNLFPHLTALDNVAIGLRKVRGIPKREARERATVHLRSVFLGDHMTKRPSELSGGQQQRVAIARAIAMEPDVILFDEPTSALDPELVQEVLDAIRALTASGMTTMIVSHELSFARQVAHRIIYMDHGAIIEQGTPAAIFGDPREERTRRFLQHFNKP